MPQQQNPGSLQRPLQLGNDTFRGLAGGSSASGLRTAFYGKTMGEVELQKDLLCVQSPISGSTLTAANSLQHGTVRDPITGTLLRLSCGHAEIVMPVMRQQQVHARTFYLRRDYDITVAMLRKTNKVTRYTNEKIGTAGQPTGLDRTLQDTLAGGKLRCSKAKELQ
ncbi:hypothetical protein COO60DRAFT_1281807 [Scenedesmus sp. NREL 46B-D3]|nr:hypothetical protein COO60DRAFT_1281807 [Scenedesmus sp. NREL 46B-D3]